MQKLSSIAVWIQQVIVFLIVPAIILTCIFSGYRISVDALYVSKFHVEHDISTLPTLGKALFFGLESLSALFLLAVMWYFFKILGFYRKGIYFSEEIITNFKKVTVVVLAMAIYELFFDTFASLLISLFRPTGQRYIMVSLSFNDIIRFFIVLTLFMILYLLQEAYRLKKEEDLVV